MLVQIVVDALEELLTTHIEHELLQHGSTLGIGDAVEIDIRVIQIVDRRDDRVGGAQLILAQCPALLAGADVNVAQASFHSVASAVARVDVNSAKDSLSHRSFHHFMVT